MALPFRSAALDDLDMSEPAVVSPQPPKFATRGRGKLLALLLATLICAYLCYLLAEPFLPAAVWAVTLAVVTRKYRDRLAARFKSQSLVAIIGVTVVSIALLVPVAFVGVVAAQQLSDVKDRWTDAWEKDTPQKTVSEWVAKYPKLKPYWEDAWREIKKRENVPQVLNQLRAGALAAVTGPLAVGLQMVLMLFFLFYLYRDKENAVAGFKHLLPLNEREARELSARLIDTIDATIYGKFVVALLQGSLMAVMFWIVGISGAVLWGAVMTLLAVIPYLGSFVIWAPAAAYMALQGDWGKAALLVGWGAIVVGTIDNVVYPMLVRDQLRQHTAIAMVGILGGIAVFGMTGIVLGPVIITVMMFLLDTWRRRTDHGQAAERA